MEKSHKTLQRIERLQRLNSAKEWINDDLYRLMYKEDLYIAAYERMANLATKAAVEGRQHLTIHTPLIALTKKQIIAKGLELGVDYALTRTCYDPSPRGEACGHCDACLLRLKGFADIGIEDPTPYQHARARQEARWPHA